MASAIAIRFDRSALTRMVVAGGAWGLALALGFFAMNYAQCGLPCPDDAAFTTLACVGTGILTIGPLAGFASPR
jgi:hypothetical protein